MYYRAVYRFWFGTRLFESGHITVKAISFLLHICVIDHISTNTLGFVCSTA